MRDEPIIIPKWIWIIPVLLVFLILGYAFSPTDQDNRPILLLPDIRAVEEYRVAIVRWREQAQELDTQISTILSGKYGDDLFTRSRESQKMIDAGVRLIQNIEQKKTPTAATPARSISLRMTSAYLEAARTTLLWTTAPNEENLAKAQYQLEIARQTLAELESSEWTTR
ncbi:MAG: hypothetical protein L6461_21550 [Anaerolineae bacterium]|nr:hypothetical protein [Anaerolineae bacterium]